MFDGASKSNPGKVGAGGLVFDPGGINPITCEWGLGELSNNRAEAYNLLLGTKILRQRGMKNLVIMGHSIIIIQSMVERSRFKNQTLNQIIKRVEKNLQYLGDVTFNHILRENNGTVDIQANLAVNHPMGEPRCYSSNMK